MTSSNAYQLAKFIDSIDDFEIYTDIDGNYDHIGATVADAILQANNRYATHVKPRVNRILETYPEARTTTAVINLLGNISAKELLSWNGEDRAERFHKIILLFAAESIETESDLCKWLLNSSNTLKLKAIKGIGQKTADYFKILVGISTCAIDRHLLSFLDFAGLTYNEYSQAQDVINSTADLLSIDRAHFDHSIWQYMSKRVIKPKKPKTRCKDH